MNTILESLEGPVFSVLRPYITPYTANLPPAVREPLVTLLTPSCYSHLIRDFSPAGHPACVQLAVSKALGLAIVGMSTILKVPQLIKLISSRSSKGLSFLSYFLETTAYLCSLAYNFRSGNPFSTYGETAMIAVQNVLIAALILQYSGRGGTWPAAAWIAVVAAAGYALFAEGVVGPEVLAYLQAATIPLGLASKVPQIVEVARSGGTGQLSAFAVFNYLLGSLARVFTTIQEVNDPLILWSFLGGTALNAILAAQMIWYWSSPSPTTSSRSTKKKPATPKKDAAQGTPKKSTPGKGKKGGAAVRRRAGTPAT